MKYLAQILFFIVVVLIVTPCCAIEENLNSVFQTVQAENQTHDEETDDCTGDCSPFYVCGNCIGFSFESLTLISFAVPLKPVKHSHVDLIEALSPISLSIWQPPKIV